MILKFFRRSAADDAVDRLYDAAVRAARAPRFYERHGVADTVEGRFEMILLHVGLLVRRLDGGGASEARLSRRLSELFFADMDRNLREMGVGDLSVGKKMQKVAAAFYGRVDAYRRGLAEPPGILEAALLRNVYAGAVADPVELAAYARLAAERLAETPQSDLHAGHVTFPDPSPVNVRGAA